MAGKIDKFGLGPEVRELNLEYPGKPGKIAKIINERHRKEGMSITRFNVSKWVKDNGLSRNQEEAIEKMSKELLARDQEDALSYHNDMFQSERKIIQTILDNDEISESDKLSEIQKVYNGSLGRTLDSFGYGKPNNQINIQNNVILNEAMDKIISVLESKFNGQSNEVIRELRRVCSPNM